MNLWNLTIHADSNINAVTSQTHNAHEFLDTGPQLPTRQTQNVLISVSSNSRKRFPAEETGLSNMLLKEWCKYCCPPTWYELERPVKFRLLHHAFLLKAQFVTEPKRIRRLFENIKFINATSSVSQVTAEQQCCLQS